MKALQKSFKTNVLMSENYLISTFTKGRNGLLQFARRMLNSHDEAEDALQEAFSRLWPSAEQLQSRDDADRLAFVAVRNISLNRLRQQLEHPTADIDGYNVDDALSNNPEVEREREEQFCIVNRLIESRLTPLQQRILRLHDMEGYGYDEIAEREQMQEPAVRMQLSRARKTIRECYLEIEKEYGQ